MPRSGWAFMLPDSTIHSKFQCLADLFRSPDFVENSRNSHVLRIWRLVRGLVRTNCEEFLLPDGIRIDPFLLSAAGFDQIASRKI